jgi:hypothetical protein
VSIVAFIKFIFRQIEHIEFQLLFVRFSQVANDIV